MEICIWSWNGEDNQDHLIATGSVPVEKFGGSDFEGMVRLNTPGETDGKAGSVSIGIQWHSENKASTAHGQDANDTDQKNGLQKQIPFYFQKVLFWDSSNGTIPPDLLQRAYLEIDDNNSGYIDKFELIKALQLCGLRASQPVWNNLFNELDKDTSGQIDTQEFFAFLLDRGKK